MGGGGKNSDLGGMSFWKKNVKSGLLRMHFQHSRAKVRVFEQNTDIIKFWLFHAVIAHEYSIFKLW